MTASTDYNEFQGHYGVWTGEWTREIILVMLGLDTKRTQPNRSIGFVSVWDPKEVKAWSGTPYYMARSLEKHLGKLEFIGPLMAHNMLVIKAYKRLTKLLFKRNYSIFHSEFVSRRYAAEVKARILAVKPDIVIAPAGSTVAAGIPAGTRFVYISDATFKLLDGYHPNYRDLSRSSRRAAEELECRAIERADLLLYPTTWAADSAIRDYGANPEKVHVIPWGANLEEAPEREVALKPRDEKKCFLVFIGVNWREKGGDIALETMRSLRKRGIGVELSVCGCEPPSEEKDDQGLRVYPFLDKQNVEDRNLFHHILENAHFLVLPTRADCYGIAFCEAAAFGIPSIGTATGGVPGVIQEGRNGHLLPLEARGDDYAELIASILGNRSRYLALRESSRKEYEERLNWNSWGERASNLIASLL